MNFQIKPQKHCYKLPILLWFLFFSGNVLGQNLTQMIRGFVTDEDTHGGLIGATVSLQGLDAGTMTDENGSFRLAEIPVGRYSLEVSYIGYETLVISELLLESGKELVLEIELKESTSSLKEVVVKALAPNLRDNIFPSPEVLTVEETLRLPATFFDPARLVLSYAGVASTNDQANHIIVRGNSPNNTSWRLEGVEIVNPNHLGSAGTVTDRPSKNGGGVNILSAQLLGNSVFLRGAYPAAYGNVLGGVMDMNFRRGNNERHEFTGQIGVIGIDLAAEGPLSKKSKASYLVNYRYSTLGLLGLAGVDLGDEFITFQDVALNVHLPMKKGGSLTLFGFGGTSENDFQAKAKEDWEIEKDIFNINSTSNMGAIGLKYFQPINDEWNFNLVGVGSSSSAIRSAEVDTLGAAIQPINRDDVKEDKLSIHAFLKYKMSAQARLRFGVVNTLLKDENSRNSLVTNSIESGGSIEGTLLQPYMDWSYSWSKVNLNLGVRSVFFSYNNSSSLEPRGSFQWEIAPQQKLGLAYGLQSQRQLSQVYNIGEDLIDNATLEMTKAHHFSLLYEKSWKGIQFNVETYYQSIFDVPVAKNEINSFSALNVFEELVNRELVNEGTGRNYGIEISTQQYFSNNIFWLGNVSLFESKYKGSDGIERDTRFNGNYIFNGTFGKEFPYSKKGRDYILGVNIHAVYAGGMRETPIDEIASEVLQQTIYVEEGAFSLQQDDYFKTDLRVYWKRNKKRFNSTLALDIQNVTNRKNSSFKYYDTFIGGVEQNFQLGLIPILSYRIEF